MSRGQGHGSRSSVTCSEADHARFRRSLGRLITLRPVRRDCPGKVARTNKVGLHQFETFCYGS
jgi:hypothetical protein